MENAKRKFKPPYKIDLAFYLLSREDQMVYRREMSEWICEEGAKHTEPKDFSRLTAENYFDLVDDDRDRISPEQRESLRRDVLAGRVIGTVDGDGTMHLGQVSVVRRRSDG